MKAYVPAPALDDCSNIGLAKSSLTFSVTSHGCGPNEFTGPHSMAIAYINTCKFPGEWVFSTLMAQIR